MRSGLLRRIAHATAAGCAILLLPWQACSAAAERAPHLPDPTWIREPGTAAGARNAQAAAAKNTAARTERTDAMLPRQALPFEARCADPNVILCDPLDEGGVRGVAVNARTRNATLAQALKGRYGDWRWCEHGQEGDANSPMIDHEVKASGSGALKFVVPGHAGPNGAGACQINFTPDNSVQFGEGETFFVQFRLRLSCSLLFTDCDPSSPGYKKQRRQYHDTSGGPTSFKVSIINAGDHRQMTYPASSCSAQEIVLNDMGDNVIGGYHSCGWYEAHMRYMGMQNGQGVWNMQPRKGDTSAEQACTKMSGKPMSPECVRYPADEWITITQQVTVGRWAEKSNDPPAGSNVRVWLQREGKAPQLLIDHDRPLRRPEQAFMKYGKIWLLPYMTNRDARESHPEAYMWFDELIVSRAPIAPAK